MLLIVATLVGAAALAAASSRAAPLVGAPACVGTAPACVAGDTRLLPVDWFEDLFGISLPPGPWRDNCRKGRVDGHYLNAECKRKSGAYRNTTFDLRKCDGDIGYDGGKLFCARGSRGEGDEVDPNKPVDPGKD